MASEAQRKAIRKYEETVDRVNVRLPKGTKERIKKIGYSVNNFIILAVVERLEKEERILGR